MKHTDTTASQAVRGLLLIRNKANSENIRSAKENVKKLVLKYMLLHVHIYIYKYIYIHRHTQFFVFVIICIYHFVVFGW